MPKTDLTSPQTVQKQPNVAGDPAAQPSSPNGVEIQPSIKPSIPEGDNSDVSKARNTAAQSPIDRATNQQQQQPSHPPSVARWVHYRPTEQTKQPDDGAVYHNGVTHDDVLAALIVRVPKDDSGEQKVNLLVHTDGGGIAWKTGVPHGDGPGQWQWPARV